MAQIPVGNFGYQTARPSAAPVPENLAPTEFRGQMAVLGGAASAASQIQAQQNEIAEAAARAQSLTAMSDAQLEYKKHADQLAQDVLSGTVPKDQAQDEWRQRTDGLATPYLDTVAPKFRSTVEAQLKAQDGEHQVELQRVVTQKNRDDITGSIISQGDKLRRQFATQPQKATEQYNAMLDNLGPTSNLSAPQRENMRETFASEASYQYFYNALTGAMESGPGIKKIMLQINDPDGPGTALDPRQRDDLLRWGTSRIGTLDDKAERDTLKRENMGLRVLSERDDMIAKGLTPNPKLLTDAEGLLTGTASEPLLQESRENEQAVAELMLKDPAAQLEEVRKLNAEAAGSADRKTVQRAQLLTKAATENVNTLVSNPVRWLQTRGGEPPQILGPNDLTDPTPQTMAALADRASSIRALQLKYPGEGIKMSPLLPEEVTMVSQALDHSPPQLRAAVLGRMASGVDTETFVGMMTQLAPNQPAIAVAGEAQAQRVAAAAGKIDGASDKWMAVDVPARIIKGQSIVSGEKTGEGKSGQLDMYLPQGWQTTFNMAFNDETGGAFAGKAQAASQAYEATKAYVVGALVDSGETFTDADVRDAVHMAIGHAHDVNGSTIIIPPQYDPKVIANRIDDQLDELARTYKGFAGFLTTARLQPDPSDGGGTRFFVKYTNGDGFKYPGTERPMMIDIAKPATPAPPRVMKPEATPAPGTGLL
jgi:hypothetical protein